jgi:hypothetical protein
VSNQTINVELKHNLHKKQQELHKLCLDEKLFFVTCLASRQSGKSYYAEYLLSYLPLTNNDLIIWYVTPSETQGKKVYRSLLAKLKESGLIKKSLSTAGDIRIEFVNGSVVEFKSSYSEETLRGNSVHYLIMDESATIKRETIYEILLPTLNATGKKCILLSTARGRNNVFYEYYMKGLNRLENPRFGSISFSFRDNPKSNLEFIQTVKENIPEKVYQQEYENQFNDASAVFSEIGKSMNGEMQRELLPGQRCWAGIDVGLKNDYTVITLIDEKANVIYIDKFRGDAPTIKNKLRLVINKFRPVKASIERNGLGLPIYDDLILEYKHILLPFLTNNDSKNTIISNLINAFEEKLIVLPKTNNKEDYPALLKNELEDFGFKFTTTGKIIYSSISGNDDMVMSLAIAYDTFLNNRRSNRMTIMVG